LNEIHSFTRRTFPTKLTLNCPDEINVLTQTDRFLEGQRKNVMAGLRNLPAKALAQAGWPWQSHWNDRAGFVAAIRTMTQKGGSRTAPRVFVKIVLFGILAVRAYINRMIDLWAAGLSEGE
jgi:hypothetical protein